MTRNANNKKVNNVITSAKKSFVRFLTLGLAVGTISGCGKKDIDTTVSTAKFNSEMVSDENEKAVKAEKIVISNIFDAKKYFAGSDAGLYDDEGKKVGTLDINSILKIIGSSEDGNWFKTEDGFLVKKSELNETPVTHVKAVNPEIVYTQYFNVRVHKSPDKTSDVIIELSINKAVLKTGEVEFASGDEVTKIDSSGDHGWSEVKFKMEGVETIGYVYTDYIGTGRSETRTGAVEVPSYSDEEKAALNEKAASYNLDVTASTDEEYEELKNTIAALENPDTNKSAIEKWADKMVADAEAKAEEARQLEEAREKELRENAERDLEKYNEFMRTHTFSQTKAEYVLKPYDHAATNAYNAWADEQIRQEKQAFEDFETSHGGVVSTELEEGDYWIDGDLYHKKYTDTYADGHKRIRYRGQDHFVNP